MESLDTPTPTAQTYSDSHNSPVDPTLFNNKRDSAYSSFSASSNTSDYATVPLRFGEAGSMDNLLQNLEPTCQGFPSGDASTQALDDGQLTALKSRSLTRPRPKPVQVRERPSSCCYEDDRRPSDFGSLRNDEQESQRKSNPPQPPTRKDSFRATKSCPNVPNKRCASAPIEMTNVPSYYEDNTTSIKIESVHNGFPASEEDDKTERYKDNTLDSYYIQNQASLTSSSHDTSKAESIYRPQTKHSSSTVLHRHSAPEKLLATQLQLLEFDSDNAPIEPYIPPKPTNQSSSSSSQWSQAQPERDQESLHSHLQASSNRWSGSRCSTPGSVFLEDGGEDGDCNERLGVNGGCRSPTQSQVSWGRSVSVPEEPLGSLTQSKHNSKQILERDFEPISSAASVDTLVEKKAVKLMESIDGDVVVKKSARNLRKNRRRNERFATNLRNEIQRKKAQLQSSRGPGGLLCSGETVHEEGPEFHEEGESDGPETRVSFASTATAQAVQTVTPVGNSNSEVLPNQSNTSRSVHIVDPGVPNFGVGIRVVEEPAPVGKARRWRWTPEHKLQPEDKPKKHDCEKVLGVTKSRHGVCAFTSSTATYSRSSSCSRMDESDLLPFADRMKFFEETSKGIAGLKAPSQTRQKHYHPENQGGDLGPYQSQRRYSYQGGYKQESSSIIEARSQSLSTKEREREREERLRQLEIERQARELELERTRLREREKEERMRQWERDRELERQQEIERIREMDRLKREKEELEKQKQWEDDFKPSHEFYGSNNPELHQDFHQHKDHFHSFQPHGFSQSQGSRSAFYPVNSSSQHFENQQRQGYTARSHTPTEMYPARQQETTKLNRKYSLTERDYPSRRWESRPSEHSHQNRWGQRQADSSASNGYTSAPAPAPLSLRTRAMSENDLRFDSNHRWSPSISSSQTLREVEEGVSINSTNPPIKKKMPPPPRPPPPKWEQFHRRRASHHALYSSFVPLTVTGGFSSQSSLISEPEMSRQRSYSLPPQRQDVSGGCPKCSCHQSQPQASSNQPPAQEIQRYPQVPSNQSQPQLQEPLFNIAPPSPMFSRRAFRPVAPPQRDRDVSVRDSFSGEQDEFPPPPPPVADDISNSLFDTETSQIPDQVQVQIIKTQTPNTRHTAEWERTPSPRILSNTSPLLVVENGNPEPFYSIDSNINNVDQQKHPESRTESETTLSPTPAQSLEGDLDVPMETDIDDFQEVELPVVNEPISSELPCFALPVTVLETDLDTLPGAEESSPSGRTRLESSSLDEELEVREGLCLEDIFPQSSEGESGTESWRGPSQSTEHNTDSLDRRSGASSSCSSYYSTSTAKAQLLTQMKDFTENRDEDDELTYKKQLMESLRKKLGVLREAQRGLQEDIRANAQLGEEVESMVEAVCKPNEVDKFRMFIGDLDKVVSLMLSLSGRLLRVETTLDTLDAEADHDERLPLLEKKRQLMRQLSEAQDLKEHVDRREQAVSRVLGRCLTPEQHRDYSHFVKMKAALLVEQRQLEDKIRLGEEQLRGLRESLGLGLGMGLGLSMGYGQY